VERWGRCVSDEPLSRARVLSSSPCLLSRDRESWGRYGVPDEPPRKERIPALWCNKRGRFGVMWVSFECTMGCCREHWWGGVESAAPLPRATKRSAQRNSLCNRICDYMRVCVYASVCICECVYACVCVYTHGCVYMRLCVYPSVFICLFLQCVRADNCSALFHTLSRCIMHIISVYCSPLSRSRFRLSYRFGLHGFNLCQPSTLLTTFNIKVLQKLSVFPTNTNTYEKKGKKENIKKT